MSPGDSVVFLVDDDPSILKALSRGLEAKGFPVVSWSSPHTFLCEHDWDTPGCLVTDLAMPGLNGLDLQAALSTHGYQRFIVFITGKGDISTAVAAMKAGAVSFLPKPVKLDVLSHEVTVAIEKDKLAREQLHRGAALVQRLGSLTPREQEVLSLLVAGKMNKQIAAVLGAAEKTIKVHRGRVMTKMCVRSLADLFTSISQVDAALLASMRRTGLCKTERTLGRRICNAPEHRPD
jgi:FixJ family two-component response regulator